VIVTRNGKAVAVLLAVTDEDELERLILAHSPKFRRFWINRPPIEETGGIPHEDFCGKGRGEPQKPAKQQAGLAPNRALEAGPGTHRTPRGRPRLAAGLTTCGMSATRFFNHGMD